MPTSSRIDEPVVYTHIPASAGFTIPVRFYRFALRQQYNDTAKICDDQAGHHQPQRPLQRSRVLDTEDEQTDGNLDETNGREDQDFVRPGPLDDIKYGKFGQRLDMLSIPFVDSYHCEGKGYHT